jgi:hypothetical protein
MTLLSDIREQILCESLQSSGKPYIWYLETPAFFICRRSYGGAPRVAKSSGSSVHDLTFRATREASSHDNGSVVAQSCEWLLMDELVICLIR